MSCNPNFEDQASNFPSSCVTHWFILFMSTSFLFQYGAGRKNNERGRIYKPVSDM